MFESMHNFVTIHQHIFVKHALVPFFVTYLWSHVTKRWQRFFKLMIGLLTSSTCTSCGWENTIHIHPASSNTRDKNSSKWQAPQINSCVKWNYTDRLYNSYWTFSIGKVPLSRRTFMVTRCPLSTLWKWQQCFMSCSSLFKKQN
jgi:hypothetical protein